MGKRKGEQLEGAIGLARRASRKLHQLRRMLKRLSIRTIIPPELAGLQALAKSMSLDGPGVFTFIRNRLTHPPRVSATKNLLPYYEAYCLAQWYVELAILSACGYSGVYGNRTILRR